MILKDASAFNIVFQNNQPILIDHSSFEKYEEGQAWQAYSQFCRGFLFPLLISSYEHMEFQPLLRAYIDELGVEVAASFFGWGDIFKGGVLKDVLIQRRLNEGQLHQGAAQSQVVRQFKISKEVIRANLKRLKKIISKLVAPGTSEWSHYEDFHNYDKTSESQKKNFVQRIVEGLERSCRIDLGCNTGLYSDLLALSAQSVVSLDIDSVAIDRQYRRIGKKQGRHLFVENMANPSPALGWNNHERSSLFERIHGDFFLGLAYSLEGFREACSRRFEIVFELGLSPLDRRLFHIKRKPQP